MKAVAVTAPGVIEIRDGIPQPKPGPYQALVKTELACLCNATDSELVKGRFPGMEQSFPFALGHEDIGLVEEVGPKARNFRVGDRVIGGLVFEFGDSGMKTGWGGFCEYTLANDHQAMVDDGVADEANGWVEVFEIQTVVDPDIRPEDAVLLSTWREVLGAFGDFQLKPGDDVLIIGGGPVGLSFVKLGRLFGLGWIGLVDSHEEKRARARAFGADEVFEKEDPRLGNLADLRGRKLDAVIDAVGRSEIIDSALPLVKRGGSLCLYGFLAGQPLALDQVKADYNFNL
ncbi:MAG: zinc-binding dehydrogenase, partial [Verrucomicrobiota bacterium]